MVSFLISSLTVLLFLCLAKSGKSPSLSDSYRPIALASSLSKLLECLQFGFNIAMYNNLIAGKIIIKIMGVVLVGVVSMF